MRRWPALIPGSRSTRGCSGGRRCCRRWRRSKDPGRGRSATPGERPAIPQVRRRDGPDRRAESPGAWLVGRRLQLPAFAQEGSEDQTGASTGDAPAARRGLVSVHLTEASLNHSARCCATTPLVPERVRGRRRIAQQNGVGRSPVTSSHKPGPSLGRRGRADRTPPLPRTGCARGSATGCCRRSPCHRAHTARRGETRGTPVRCTAPRAR